MPWLVQVREKIGSTQTGRRLLTDRRYRSIAKAVLSLTGNLVYVFYNGIMGVVGKSLLLVTAAVYYLLLSAMRFIAVLFGRKDSMAGEKRAALGIGVLLILLSIFFPIIVLLNMKHQAAAVYGTIPMITIATYTFIKIALAIQTAIEHREDPSGFFRAINGVRYAEVAVSLFTMQQSMLVSFGNADDGGTVVLNACTGMGVFVFLFVLGIWTCKNSKGETYGKIKNGKSK